MGVTDLDVSGSTLEPYTMKQSFVIPIKKKVVQVKTNPLVSFSSTLDTTFLWTLGEEEALQMGPARKRRKRKKLREVCSDYFCVQKSPCSLRLVKLR